MKKLDDLLGGEDEDGDEALIELLPAKLDRLERS